jgi:hypothetical protein
MNSTPEVLHFDHCQEVHARYEGRFIVCASSVCLPIERPGVGAGAGRQTGSAVQQGSGETEAEGEGEDEGESESESGDRKRRRGGAHPSDDTLITGTSKLTLPLPLPLPLPPWSRITALVSSGIAEANELYARGIGDRESCKRDLFLCKRRFEGFRDLAESMAAMQSGGRGKARAKGGGRGKGRGGGGGGDCEDEASDDAEDAAQGPAALWEIDSDPTLCFSRLVSCPCPRVATWSSVLGSLALPPQCAFRLGDVSRALRSMARLSACQQRYKVRIRWAGARVGWGGW